MATPLDRDEREHLIREEYAKWTQSVSWANTKHAHFKLLAFEASTNVVYFSFGAERERYQFGVHYGANYPTDFATTFAEKVCTYIFNTALLT
jgi:hypothetical protein